MIFLISIGFLDMSFADILDILLVSFIMYQLYNLVKGSVASRILLGGIAVYALYLLVSASGMEMLSTILGQFMGVGVLVIIILFQQEIRKFLLVIGKATPFGEYSFLKSIWSKNSSSAENKQKITAVVEASQEMSASLTGALIVFSRSSELKFYAESGDEIDATISKRLLISIFQKFSPLHDGAVIVSRDGRIVAARCILPVSENDELPASLGLRHRAAIGLTEIADAIVVVVSEETGQMSIVRNGKIYRNLDSEEMTQRLTLLLSEDAGGAAKSTETEQDTSAATTDEA
ncbi:MAG TPA: TIGR00159 family protein [Microscillaceae bacterium]|nr:TIGR00159 family protein [Microscillaceae bacterium]